MRSLKNRFRGVEVILDTNALSDFAEANQRLLNSSKQTAAQYPSPRYRLR